MAMHPAHRQLFTYKLLRAVGLGLVCHWSDWSRACEDTFGGYTCAGLTTAKQLYEAALWHDLQRLTPGIN